MIDLDTLPPDLRYVESLMRVETKRIGWMPAVALRQAYDRGRIVLHRENDQPLGYCVWSHNKGVLKCFQIVVQNDARRLIHGTRLIAKTIAAAAHYRPTLISLRCAIDLDSHLFWQALGFIPVAVAQGKGKNKRQLIVYHRGTPWTQPSTPKSCVSLASLVSVSVATWAPSPCTPPGEGKPWDILDHHQKISPHPGKYASEIDSASLKAAGLLKACPPSSNGNGSLLDLPSVQLAKMFTCRSALIPTRNG